MARYTRPSANFDGAANGNPQDRRALDLQFNQRLLDLEKKAGGSSIDLATSRPAATAPDAAMIQVENGPGTFIIQLANPTNTSGAPVKSIVDFSDTPTFSKVQSIDAGTQPYLEVTKFGASVSKYVRVRSSLDGVNFSKPRIAGLYTTGAVASAGTGGGTGPAGPQGPAGPTGPQGPAGTGSAARVFLLMGA